MRTAFRFIIPASCAALLAAVPAVFADDPAPAPHGLQGTYFDNEDFTGASTTRLDPAIDFTWEGRAPADGIAAYTYSVRWTGTVTPRYSERYTFRTSSDDGVRVWVDGQLLINDWNEHRVRSDAGDIGLLANRPYDLKVEYYEHEGRAEAHLRWESASQAPEVVPTARLAPPAAVATTGPTGPTGPTVTEAPVTTAAPSPSPPPTTTPAPDPAPQPAEIPVAQLPPPSPPVAGETFDAAPVRGQVLLRGADGGLEQLGSAATLPIGARLDTRHGAVRIDTAKAKGVKHPKQYARLSGGTFAVGQKAAGNRVVTINLMHGDFESCLAPSLAAPTAGLAAHFAPRAKTANHQVRQLWGHGKGRFRTVGRGAAATVRGTFWNVEDTCDATVVRVKEGVVDVQDFAKGKTVTLTKGQSYTAPLKQGKG